MNQQYSNRLAQETSPYLLQHAHNPVDWYAWKPEAFEEAKKKNKPILVSIGYSTCHWCHVMERESFENKAVAEFMNEHFVCIKVDREERPDVDQIYMDVVQSLTGSGGWPLNCFLLPDGRPFYGGTYFPPKEAHNRPSWLTVLGNVSEAFQEKRDTVEQQAEKLMNYLKGADDTFVSEVELGLKKETVFTQDFIQNVYYALREKFDRAEGGFGSSPKFPGTMSLQFMMDYHYHTGNPEALEHLCFSLDRMIHGGIYDQIGGGFARYTVDREWLVPHFEKMLYDNALFVSLLSEAYKLTKKERYKETIIETLGWLQREMIPVEGGFCSALDADSEGEEGKFYVWQLEEIQKVLGKEANLFCEFYQVTKKGNWEEKNILWRPFSFQEFSQKNQIPLEELKSRMANCRQALLQERERRIRPGLDDKILLGWNALMCTAIAKAYEALQDEQYLDLAKRNLAFILLKFGDGEEKPFFHTYKNGHRQYHAFLDDYAFLIDALINVYTISQDLTYLEKANSLCEFVLEHFFDKNKNLFFFTAAQQEDLVVRRKDLYDGATPSGNSMMVINLQRLGHMLGKQKYTETAADMLLCVRDSLERYPASFGMWGRAAIREVYPILEVAVIGKEAKEKSQGLLSHFLPGSVLMASNIAIDAYPLLADREVDDETLFFLCEGQSCKMPVETVEELLILTKS